MIHPSVRETMPFALLCTSISLLRVVLPRVSLLISIISSFHSDTCTRQVVLYRLRPAPRNVACVNTTSCPVVVDLSPNRRYSQSCIPRIVTTWSLLTCRGLDKRSWDVTVLRIENLYIHKLGIHYFFVQSITLSPVSWVLLPLPLPLGLTHPQWISRWSRRLPTRLYPPTRSSTIPSRTMSTLTHRKKRRSSANLTGGSYHLSCSCTYSVWYVTR